MTATTKSGSAKKKPRRSKYDLLDLDDILARIRNGESQSEIARSLGVQQSHLSEWLHSDADRSARTRAAMEASAEAWLDRGLTILGKATARRSGIDASAARAYEQACARRAAIRNPTYRDKQQVEHSGAIRHDVRQMSDDELQQIAAAGDAGGGA